MKKLITILLISTIAMSLTFATDATVESYGYGHHGGHNGWDDNNNDDNNGSESGSDPSFAFDGSSHSAPDLDITLKGKLDPISYDLSIVYGTGTEAEDFTSTEEKTISGLDLTTEGSTEEFNVYISNGNLNNSITFKTVITEEPFKGSVDNETITTDNKLTVRAVKNSYTHQTQFSKLVSAGPNDYQSIACFDFHWTADPDLAAGSYQTTNTVSISVE
jgi:hypothetical protein